MKYIFSIFLAVWCFASCRSDSLIILDDVETYVYDEPDSALQMLSMIDSETLNRKRDKALYALLYSIALDKCYIDVASDSLISPAVDYYKSKGRPEYRMRMWYQYGRVLYNSQQYSSAVISYMKAVEIAERSNEYMLLGLANRGIAECYAKTYDLNESLKYLEIAYDDFVLADAGRYAEYALLSISKAYISLDMFDDGMVICDTLMKNAYHKKDTVMMKHCVDCYVSIFSASPFQDYEKIIACADFLSDSLNTCLSSVLLGELAVAYRYGGDVEKSRFYEERASRECADTLILRYNDYRIACASGDYRRALFALEDAALRYDEIHRSALERSVASMQRDYFIQRSEYEEFRSLAKTLSLISFSILFCIILVCVTTWYRRRIRKKERDMMLLVSQIHELSLEKDSAINEFTCRIENLYETKMKFIDSLCEKYYSYNGSVRDKYVLEEIDNMIASISDDNEIATLESIIDAFNDNVMQHIKETFPRIKEKDYRFLCYWYAGFSTWTMSLLLNERIENIYNRKSRLRKKFEETDSEYRDLFLRNLY